MTLKGSCFCGFIRYAVDAKPHDETNCHCSICRRVSGAPLVAWASVPVAAFRVVSGTPSSFRSSDHATRSFCPQCGTPLTFHSTRFPDEIDVTICSLEQPELVPPKDHTRTSAKLPWVSLGDDLPAYPESRR